MGKSETATACLGLRISMKKLIEQINETNLDLIKHIRDGGSIEDEFDMLNDKFDKIKEYFYTPTPMPTSKYNTYNTNNIEGLFRLQGDEDENEDYNSDEDENENENEDNRDKLNTNDKQPNYIEFKHNLEKKLMKYHLIENVFLLFPIKTILQTKRYGYEEGTSASSVPIYPDLLTLDLTKYKELQHFVIVFILIESSD
jgi:hypothetical protein